MWLYSCDNTVLAALARGCQNKWLFYLCGMVELALQIRVATKQRLVVFLLGGCVVIVGQIKKQKKEGFSLCDMVCVHIIE